VKYLARPADASRQTAVAKIRGATFVGDGGTDYEGQLNVFEEFGRVFLTFVR